MENNKGVINTNDLPIEEQVKYVYIDGILDYLQCNNAWRAFGFSQIPQINPYSGEDMEPYTKWVALVIFMEGKFEADFLMGGFKDDDENNLYWSHIKQQLTPQILSSLGYKSDQLDECYTNLRNYESIIEKYGRCEGAVKILHEMMPKKWRTYEIIKKSRLGLLVCDLVMNKKLDEFPYKSCLDINEKTFKFICKDLNTYFEGVSLYL